MGCNVFAFLPFCGFQFPPAPDVPPPSMGKPLQDTFSRSRALVPGISRTSRRLLPGIQGLR